MSKHSLTRAVFRGIIPGLAIHIPCCGPSILAAVGMGGFAAKYLKPIHSTLSSEMYNLLTYFHGNPTSPLEALSLRADASNYVGYAGIFFVVATTGISIGAHCIHKRKHLLEDCC